MGNHYFTIEIIEIVSLVVDKPIEFVLLMGPTDWGEDWVAVER